MKMSVRLLTVAGLLVLTLCLCLVGCDSDPAPSPETSGATEAVSSLSTESATKGDAVENPTEAVTSASTEAQTEISTEAPTEAETEPPVPTLLTVVDLDGVSGVDASSFFSRPTKCDVSLVDDETEGKVVRLITKGVSTVGTAKPFAYFELGELVENMGGILPKTTEYPHVVLKVKASGLWSRSFSFFGGPTLRDAAQYDGFARITRVADSEDWQYVYLNLTPFTKDWKVFYLNFEQAAGKNGEYMDIAEVHFFATEEEAAALCPAVSNTYPIVEQTMEDYTLKVMSFNVQTENGTSVNFDLRAEMLRDLMDQLQPDSIGMQEVTT